MALLFECTARYAPISLDTADIVRDAMLSSVVMFYFGITRRIMASGKMNRHITKASVAAKIVTSAARSIWWLMTLTRAF